MDSYRSVTLIGLSDQFICSLDIPFQRNSTLLFGIDGYEESKLSSLSDFIDNVQNLTILDNTTSLIALNKGDYRTDGRYIWRVTGDLRVFFHNKIRIYEGRVFEELKDYSKLDPSDTANIYVEANTVYIHTPRNYIIDNGIVKLDTNNVNLTTVYSFENGNLKGERYLYDNDTKEGTKKIRLNTSSIGKVLSISVKDGEIYKNVATTVFKNGCKNNECYVYLGFNNISMNKVSNLLIQYQALI